MHRFPGSTILVAPTPEHDESRFHCTIFLGFRTLLASGPLAIKMSKPPGPIQFIVKPPFTVFVGGPEKERWIGETRYIWERLTQVSLHKITHDVIMKDLNNIHEVFFLLKCKFMCNNYLRNVYPRPIAINLQMCIPHH
jgi:hypothetical protein